VIGEAVKKPEASASDKVKLWMHRLDNGIRRRAEEEEVWQRNEDFVGGKHWEGHAGDGDDVSVNKLNSWVQARMASLAFKKPAVRVTPQTPEGWSPVPLPYTDPQTGQPGMKPVAKHTIVENTINTITHHPEFGFDATIRRFIKAGLQAYGALKVGYNATTNPDTDSVKEPPEDFVTGEPDYSAYEMQAETSEPLRDANGYLVPLDGGIISEQFFVDFVPYRRMIIDPDGGNDLDSHGWIACELLMKLKDVKEDPRFKNTKDLTGTGTSREEAMHEIEELPAFRSANTTDPYIRDRSEMVRLFEIWDWVEEEMLILADGHAEELYRGDIPRGVYDHPYILLRFDERIDKDEQFYPHAPATDIVPLVDENNKYRKQCMIRTRKSTRKSIVRAGVFKPSEMAKLTSPDDSTYSEADTDGPLQDTVAVVPQAPAVGEMAAYGQIIARDIDEVAGEPGEARGVASSKTATQANVMDSYRMSRVDFQRNILAQALRLMYKKLLDSMQENLTQEVAVTINGPDGMAFQTYVDRGMILGDYDLDVDVVEMAPKNRDLERSQFMNLMTTVGQAPFLVADPVVGEAIFDMFGIKDKRITDALAKMAQMQMQGPPEQPETPGTGAPQDPAQMISQSAGGMQ